MKAIRILVAAILLLPFLASAQISITEVMYDLSSGSDSGREWIEIYNEGPAIDVTTLKLFENGTNHKITSISVDKSLQSGMYAVIASNPGSFKKDYPQYTGALFDSAFNLANTGDSFSIRTASSTDLDSLSYQSSHGGAGDGNSLNREPGSQALITRAPSPGAAMSATTIEPPKKEVKVATVKKTSAPKTAAKKDPAPLDEEEAVEEELPVQQTAAAFVPAKGSNFAWWTGAAALALAGGAAAFASRRVQRKEWDVEEIKE